MPPLEELVSDIKVKYGQYENSFFSHFKDEVVIAKEHSAVVVGVAVASAFVLMRGPRRFLIRNTLGRLQSEETKFLKAENSVKDLGVSVDIMRRESKKLLERATLAEKEMILGQNELLNARNRVRSLSKSVNQVEAQASGMMQELREIPGREAIRLRAEVASLASLIRQQKNGLNKRITRLSDLGIKV